MAIVFTVSRTGMLRIVAGIAAVLAALPASCGELPLFDAHLHYSAADAGHYTPAAVIGILDRNNVSRAVVTGTPARHAVELFRQAPTRIVPFLGAYRQPADKATWHRDTALPDRLETQLASGPWKGIGELHLFAENRHSPVFRRVVELAVKHDLPLLLHCDPAVIDSLYEHSPRARVIWAHGGVYPFPPLIRDYLERYPGLYVDLSVREDRIAPDGSLDPDWTLLLMEQAERFLVGIDTYSTRRWQQFDEVARNIRRWLGQLPEDVAEHIARLNAESLFATGQHGRSN